MEEREIIAGCLKGDRKAQYELVKRYGPRLLTICRRYAPERLEPEDILQDVFIRVFSYLDQFQGERGLLWPWMKTIAIRESLKKHRLTKRWQLDSLELNGSEKGYDSVALPMDHLNSEQIILLINKLPESYKVIFNLVAVEGYTHEECAAMLGIPSGTCRSWLSRARKSLQSQLLTYKAINV